MSQASDMNNQLNDYGMPKSGGLNSEPSTTGPNNFQKKLNKMAVLAEPDNQAKKIGNGQPSTTGPGNYQRVENSFAGAEGLGGTPKGFRVTGNK